MRYEDLPDFVKAQSYHLEAQTYNLTPDGVLKPSAYPLFFESIAEQHLNAYGINIPSTLSMGLGWALVSLAFEVDEPVSQCSSLHGNAWLSQRKGPYFRRDFMIRDGNGNSRIRGTSHAVLLNLNTRKACRKMEFPFAIDPIHEQSSVEASPQFREHPDFTELATGTAPRSSVDLMGHVNNCQYGDFVFNAMPDSDLPLLGSVRRLEYHFSSEMKVGDSYTVGRAEDAGRLIYNCRNLRTEKNSFIFIMEF